MLPSHITPRRYQEEIFQTARDKNTLVVLPTGTGKTLIAFMLSKERLEKWPGSKILFLAPTRPLAQQHLDYFKYNLHDPEIISSLFTGKVKPEKRKQTWDESDIIFSTPQCIANDIKDHLYTLEDISLLVEDEAHRCVKSYDYTYVAKTYKDQAKHQRILGLTASPGYEKKTILEICQHLGIETVEVRTRESDDVKEYLQKLEIETVYVDFPPELENIRNLIKIIFDKKVEELKNRKLLFFPGNKKTLIDLQKKIMANILSGNRNIHMLAGASACAQALKVQHAIELIETQSVSAFNTYMVNLFDQAKKAKSKAAINLVKQKEFNQAYVLATELATQNREHPKLDTLKELIRKKITEEKKKRIIVFSQFRDNVVKLCKTINQIPGVNAKVFIGQASKEDNPGLSQKEQQEIIRQFSSGEVNVIASTSIGEEGLDLPEVNDVIFYEPVPSAIRKIQRAGRTARLFPGKLTVLVTKKTRDEAYYWVAFSKEKKMYKTLNTIKEDLENQNAPSKILDAAEATESASPQGNEEKNQKSISDF